MDDEPEWEAGDRLSLCLSELVLDFQYIDAELPAESPYLYGLHPNAEIGFLTQTSEKLFRTVLELQPRDGHAGDGAGATREEKVWGAVARAPSGEPEDGTGSRSSCWPSWQHRPRLARLPLARGGVALTRRTGRPG